MQEPKRPGSTPTRPAPQWKDSDLDDIMALLEKDYTKPQPKPQAAAKPQPAARVQAAAARQTRPQPARPQPKPQAQKPPVSVSADPELDEIMALLSKDYTKPQPRSLEKAQAEMPRLTEKQPKQKKEKQPKAPKEKKPVNWLEVGLTALTGAESAALVALVIWCVLWMR